MQGVDGVNSVLLTLRSFYEFFMCKPFLFENHEVMDEFLEIRLLLLTVIGQNHSIDGSLIR